MLKPFIGGVRLLFYPAGTFIVSSLQQEWLDYFAAQQGKSLDWSRAVFFCGRKSVGGSPSFLDYVASTYSNASAF